MQRLHRCALSCARNRGGRHRRCRCCQRARCRASRGGWSAETAPTCRRNSRILESICRRRHTPPRPGDPAGCAVGWCERANDFTHACAGADVTRYSRDNDCPHDPRCGHRNPSCGVGIRLRYGAFCAATARGRVSPHRRCSRCKHRAARTRRRRACGSGRHCGSGGQPGERHRGRGNPVRQYCVGYPGNRRTECERSRPLSVPAAAGSDAAGVAAGIKRTGALDLALVVNRGPLTHAAAVFTSNRSQANPILWSKQIIADGRVDAIVLNSGGANCFTGSEGFQVTHRTAEAAATALGISAGDVLVCSTGLIGEQLNPEVLEEGVLSAVDRLAATVDAGLSAARAIMTTDSAPKTVIVEGGGAHESGGERKGKGERDEGKRVSRDAGAAATSSTFTRDQTTGWRIGGMAKGAGMLAPGLATMLVVLTTDAVVSASDLDAARPAPTPRNSHPPPPPPGAGGGQTVSAGGPPPRNPGELRPARLRRVHVNERSGHAARERCLGNSPGGGRFYRGPHQCVS